ncbi:MAG: hypothetical protein F6K09_02305 [Merismopedia sp. SIO2A8]|nr:hypothetical protein [Merismopedia sp. SIO2A8]
MAALNKPHQLQLFVLSSDSSKNTAAPAPQPREVSDSGVSGAREQMDLQMVLDQRLSSETTISSEDEKRILHLEQALDQALIYLKELREQVKNQSQLEEQLASMEDYAYVQYQAITHLQAQVAQYQTTLSEQDTVIVELTSDTTLTKSNEGNSQLEVQQGRDILQQENAQWKHACQELQQECDRQHRKLASLEQEKATMQEQILQQVRRLDEGETAIQYWKDQHTLRQQQLQQLIQRVLGVLERKQNAETVQDPLDVSELLGILNSIQIEQPSSPSFPPTTANSLALPDFLVRRHHHRFDSPPGSLHRGHGASST